MPNKSPSKVLRNVKRITKFLEKKPAEKKYLAVHKLPDLDIPPTVKSLNFSQPTIISILPSRRHLEFSKPVLTNIPPEIPNSCLSTTKLLNPLMNLTKLQTSSNMCTQPSPLLERIPQLDGGIEQEVLKCKNCKKTMVTADDIKWHFETQLGREDCSILRSMLGWHPNQLLNVNQVNLQWCHSQLG